jgi:hypothetical protein
MQNLRIHGTAVSIFSQGRLASDLRRSTHIFYHYTTNTYAILVATTRIGWKKPDATSGGIFIAMAGLLFTNW